MTTDNNTALPTPPAWCEPDARPDWDSVTADGGPLASWCRDFGDGVWIGCDDTIQDGRWVRGPATIYLAELFPEGMDAAGARRLGAQLLNAADTVDTPNTRR
jgi:hypothetical protein